MSGVSRYSDSLPYTTFKFTLTLIYYVALTMTQRKMKDAASRDTTMPGAHPAVTDDELLEYLKSGVRPVYTAPNVADRFDITRQTAHRRLKELAEESPHIAVTNIGQADAYYVPGVEVSPPGDTKEERHRHSIEQWATDRFVGLHTEPWTAVHPNDGPATAGDKIQLHVQGHPGEWSIFYTRSWETRREQLEPNETMDRQTEALVSGELYTKPTVPVRHLNWPDDYDLELNLGTHFETVTNDDGHERAILIASGVKNYELQACDDAVFFTNASVDWISPAGDGQTVLSVEETKKLREELSAEELAQKDVIPTYAYETYESIEDVPDDVPVDRRAIEEDDDNE